MSQEMDTTTNKQKSKTGTIEKLGVDGILFYVLIFLVVVGLPVASVVILFNAVNSLNTP